MIGARAEGQFSPDGKWLASAGVVVQPVAGGGGRIQMSRGPGSQPRWSRDGKKIFLFAPDRELMEVPIGIRGGELLPGAPRPLFQTHVTAPRLALFEYDVTRDASRFLVKSLKPEAPLTLNTGWPAALRR